MDKPTAKQFALLQVEGADVVGKGSHAVFRLGIAAETQAELLKAPRRVEHDLVEQLARIRQERGLPPLPDFKSRPYA